MDDKSIVDLYWKRSEQAISETDHKYGGYCFSVAYNVLNNREDSEECVSDTYMAAWENLPPHRPAVLITFLGKLTRRISITRWRQLNAYKRGGGEIILALDELDECVADPRDVEGQYLRKESTQCFNRFLDALPQTERDVFLRRYFLLDPIKDIAANFGFSESKVKVMLHRTREKLRSALKKGEITMNSNNLLDIIGDAKDQHILSAIKTREMAPRRRSLNKALLIAIAATLILVTMTGAAVYTRWSKSMNSEYQASQEQRAQAQDVGLSTMLEREKTSDDILSVTDQGITVTAVQTVADDYHMKIVFRIEGLTYTEGMPPFAFPAEATLDGVPMHEALEGGYSNSGWFHDGIMINDDWKPVYDDGTPIQKDANGDWIYHYLAPDGSMEYILDYTFGKPAQHLGKVIEVGFDAFAHSVGPADVEKDVEGRWRLRWKITGSEESYKKVLNVPLGDSGDVVKEIEITPMSIGAVVQTKDFYDCETALGGFPRGIAGLRMKDGSTMTLLGGGGSSGYQDEANTLYRMRIGASRLYKVEDVDAVLFHNYVQDENAENGIYLTDENGHYLDELLEVPIR